MTLVEDKCLRPDDPDADLAAIHHLLDDDFTYCEVCGSPDDEDEMLLCDACDAGYHLDCVGLQWGAVRTYFFCPGCRGAGRERDAAVPRCECTLALILPKQGLRGCSGYACLPSPL